MKLVLIGLRGTGKSSAGRLLAERLRWDFFDTDLLVQERAGKTIRELFETFGEAHFRKLESEVVQKCARADNAVIATGGGAVLDSANTAALKAHGFVVPLTASPSELWTRISQDHATHDSRPRLVKEAGSELDELKKLMLSRAAVYAEARDVEVQVEGRSLDKVADAILLLMRVHGVLKNEAAK